MKSLTLCRIVTDGEKREVWRLFLENVSIFMKPEEKDREQNMYKDVSSKTLISDPKNYGAHNDQCSKSLITVTLQVGCSLFVVVCEAQGVPQ